MRIEHNLIENNDDKMEKQKNDSSDSDDGDNLLSLAQLKRRSELAGPKKKRSRHEQGGSRATIGNHVAKTSKNGSNCLASFFFPRETMLASKSHESRKSQQKENGERKNCKVAERRTLNREVRVSGELHSAATEEGHRGKLPMQRKKPTDEKKEATIEQTNQSVVDMRAGETLESHSSSAQVVASAESRRTNNERILPPEVEERNSTLQQEFKNEEQEVQNDRNEKFWKQCVATTKNALFYLSKRAMLSSSKSFCLNNNFFRSLCFSHSGVSSKVEFGSGMNELSTSYYNNSTVGGAIITCLSFDSQGILLAVACTKGCIRIYDCDTLFYLSSLSSDNNDVGRINQQWDPCITLNFEKHITNLIWNPDNQDEIAVSFASGTFESIIVDIGSETAVKLSGRSSSVTSNNGRTTSLLFIPSEARTATQIMAGYNNGTMRLWSLQTSSNRDSASIIKKWKIVFDACAILEQGEPIADMKYLTGGIVVIGGVLGTIVVMDIFCHQKKIFSKEIIPFIVKVISIKTDNTQPQVQNLATFISNDKSINNTMILERATIFVITKSGSVTCISLHPRQKQKATNSATNSHSQNYYYDASIKTLDATDMKSKTDHEKSNSTNSEILSSTISILCRGDILLFQNPLLYVGFFVQQHSSTFKTNTTATFDRRILSSTEQGQQETQQYALQIVVNMLGGQQQKHIAIPLFENEPCAMAVHPNNQWIVVGYRGGKNRMELVSVGTNHILPKDVIAQSL